MTYEEALKEITTVCYGMDRYLQEAIEKAIEKHIPKKPIVDKYEGHCGWKCECGSQVWLHMNYCSKCGNRLDWSEE